MLKSDYISRIKSGGLETLFVLAALALTPKRELRREDGVPFLPQETLLPLSDPRRRDDRQIIYSVLPRLPSGISRTAVVEERVLRMQGQ